MNGDNVLKLLSRTMEDILNIFSNNLKDFTACMGVLCMPVSSKFLTESTGEKNTKIGQYLVKIWTKCDNLGFLGHPVHEAQWAYTNYKS